MHLMKSYRQIHSGSSDGHKRDLTVGNSSLPQSSERHTSERQWCLLIPQQAVKFWTTYVHFRNNLHTYKNKVSHSRGGRGDIYVSIKHWTVSLAKFKLKIIKKLTLKVARSALNSLFQNIKKIKVIWLS